MIDVDIEQHLGDFLLQVKFRANAPVVGVFGRSGAGKSSLVNAIAGVTTPRRGHVRVNGETLFDSARRINLSPPARRVGYVFQDSLLFPHLSVNANLKYGHRLRTKATHFIAPERVIDVLGLGALLQRRPDTLSGGERQRVAIGRALLAQPRILLLDEPLAALDVPRRTEILDYVERLHGEFGIPIIYVSHSVPEITRLADAVVVVSDGRCLAVGDVDEIMGRLDLKPYTGRYEAGAVIGTTVIAHDAGDQLTTLGFAGGELIVPRLDAGLGARVRARIRARDVSLAVQRPTGISILNVLAGRVTAISDESGSVVDIQVAVGDITLTARITQRSRAALDIHVHQAVFALVKAVSFDHRSTGYA
ncbi:MAG: molybdenum ABC transporter ATP-binding protein [Betaproteobacteria bacterium]